VACNGQEGIGPYTASVLLNFTTRVARIALHFLGESVGPMDTSFGLPQLRGEPDISQPCVRVNREFRGPRMGHSGIPVIGRLALVWKVSPVPPFGRPAGPALKS
jgi:hypothetical protein